MSLESTLTSVLLEKTVVLRVLLTPNHSILERRLLSLPEFNFVSDVFPEELAIANVKIIQERLKEFLSAWAKLYLLKVSLGSRSSGSGSPFVGYRRL